MTANHDDITIQRLVDDVENAKEEFESAQQTTNFARLHETECLNALNGAQKKLDKALSQLRESMPKQSDWRRDK